MISIGQMVPCTTVYNRVRDASIGGENPYRWQIDHMYNYFAGKTVVVFSLPGAFTPTCSTFQVPGFEKMAQDFYNEGVDDIYCISVNDAFVMNRWAREQCLEEVKVIPDGNGEFTGKMGLLVDKSHLGFGVRSWRYAMVLKNCVVTHLFVEPGINDNGSDLDPYGETSPENVLKSIKG